MIPIIVPFIPTMVALMDDDFWDADPDSEDNDFDDDF